MLPNFGMVVFYFPFFAIPEYPPTASFVRLVGHQRTTAPTPPPASIALATLFFLQQSSSRGPGSLWSSCKMHRVQLDRGTKPCRSQDAGISDGRRLRFAAMRPAPSFIVHEQSHSQHLRTQKIRALYRAVFRDYFCGCLQCVGVADAKPWKLVDFTAMQHHHHNMWREVHAKDADLK